MQITDMTLLELRDTLRARQVSPDEVFRAYHDRISALNPSLNAFISVNHAPELPVNGAFSGIPVALKDNLCVAGGRTTCASKMLADFTSPYSATAWNRLAGQGCVLLGKTNMDEFAMGSDTTSSHFGATRNPAAPERVPGGSSGGSAAAVAAKLTPLALGSDTGGSIRQPAAFCGVVGMKPTYGLVSRHGLVAFASSLDCVGPITRTVADNAFALSLIAGRDTMDATTVDAPVLPVKPIRQMRIGIPNQMMTSLSGEVRAAIDRAVRILTAQGATLIEVDLPHLTDALSAYYIISSAEASSNLARYDGLRYGHRAEDFADLEALYTRSRTEGFGTEVKRRIMLGAFALSAGYVDAYYNRALQVRTLVIRDFARAFADVDCLLGPVTPCVPWKIGEKTSPMERYQADVHTVPASLAGLPALSVPCGKTADCLPIGVQLIGPAFTESTLYRVGAAIEREAV